MEQRGQGCGCCFGFVLGIVVLIVVVFSWFRWQGGTAYGAAVALQLEGQCERALPQFREVASTYSLLSDLAESAKKQISLCEALLAADQARNSGRWLEAVQAYQRTAKMAANNPFEAVPLGRLANLQAVATADNTTPEACRGIAILDALVAAGEALSAEARAALPVAVFSCGRASDNANNFPKAIDMYRRVATDYPNHPTARDARLGLRRHGDAAYAGAVALQLAGHCDRAIPQFREVASTYSLLSDLAQAARTQVSACEALLAADQARNSGRWLEAVQAYQRTAKMAANSPFEAVPLGRLANLQAVATADATTLEACRGIAILDALVAAGETLSAEARAAMPVAVFSCGRASDNANNFRKAADMYRRVVTDYPNHPTARDARRLWADAEVNAAAGTPAGLAPPPVASGRGPAGVVTIEIINDSPESLELFFSGPSSDVIVLGPCASCPKYQTFGPLTCPARGPRTVLTLRPGTYRVHVRSRDGLRVTPYNGTWTLESGTRYSECYYIVESFRLR